MDLRLDLMERFDYDLWANQQWWTALSRFKRMETPQAVLEHILSAQRVWLARLGVEVSQSGENLGMADLMSLVNRAWKMVLTDGHLDQPITYTNSHGWQFTNTIGQIATHVANHGTYHRGQLRGLAQADGLENFPETDLIGFYREKGETRH